MQVFNKSPCKTFGANSVVLKHVGTLESGCFVITHNLMLELGMELGAGTLHAPVTMQYVFKTWTVQVRITEN